MNNSFEVVWSTCQRGCEIGNMKIIYKDHDWCGQIGRPGEKG
jgi:hypothetical protein